MPSTDSRKADKPQNDETLNSKRPLDAQIKSNVLPSLYKLTEGIPRRELKLMIAEAKSSEEDLEREIKELKMGLDSAKENEEQKGFIDTVLDSEVSPVDSYFTVSALLGRLRDDLAMPLPPNSILPAHRVQVGLLHPPPKKQKKPSQEEETTTETLEKQKRLLALENNPEYAKEHSQASALMMLWKKISHHRASIVFRKPVNPKEAPGYTDRIFFPMDLSLIRKMIVARFVKSYKDLHLNIGLICHNCVKYNGRESDYGVVSREFEANAEEFIYNAVISAAVMTKTTAEATKKPPVTIETDTAQSTGVPQVASARNTSPKTVGGRSVSPKNAGGRSASPKNAGGKSASPKTTETRNVSPRTTGTRSVSPKIGTRSASPKTIGSSSSSPQPPTNASADAAAVKASNSKSPSTNIVTKKN
jgi:hypothetical protein